MSEQTEDRAHEAPEPRRGPPPPPPRLWTALLGSAIVAGVVVLAGSFATHRFLVTPLLAERDALRAAENASAARLAGVEAKLKALETEAEGLREALATRTREAEFAGQALALLRKPGLFVAELTGTKARPEASARMFWHGDGRGYLHARGLLPVAEGRALVLWVFTADDRVLLAGRLDPDTAGEAALLVELPADTGEIVRALVSDERDVGETPQGSLQLVWSGP